MLEILDVSSIILTYGYMMCSKTRAPSHLGVLREGTTKISVKSVELIGLPTN